MKSIPALLIALFVLSTAIMTRFAMQGRVVPPQPAPYAAAAADRRPPRSASVDDLVRHFADVPVDLLHARLDALDLPNSTIEQVIRARLFADIEARTQELAREQGSAWRDLQLTPPAASFPPPKPFDVSKVAPIEKPVITLPGAPVPFDHILPKVGSSPANPPGSAIQP